MTVCGRQYVIDNTPCRVSDIDLHVVKDLHKHIYIYIYIKRVFGVKGKNKDLDRSTEIHSLIKNFALLHYVLQYLIIL